MIYTWAYKFLNDSFFCSLPLSMYCRTVILISVHFHYSTEFYPCLAFVFFTFCLAFLHNFTFFHFSFCFTRTLISFVVIAFFVILEVCLQLLTQKTKARLFFNCFLLSRRTISKWILRNWHKLWRFIKKMTVVQL